MVIASLAWSLKAWFALLTPVSPRWRGKHEADRERAHPGPRADRPHRSTARLPPPRVAPRDAALLSVPRRVVNAACADAIRPRAGWLPNRRHRTTASFDTERATPEADVRPRRRARAPSAIAAPLSLLLGLEHRILRAPRIRSLGAACGRVHHGAGGFSQTTAVQMPIRPEGEGIDSVSETGVIGASAV